MLKNKWLSMNLIQKVTLKTNILNIRDKHRKVNCKAFKIHYNHLNLNLRIKNLMKNKIMIMILILKIKSLILLIFIKNIEYLK